MGLDGHVDKQLIHEVSQYNRKMLRIILYYGVNVTVVKDETLRFCHTNHKGKR